MMVTFQKQQTTPEVLEGDHHHQNGGGGNSFRMNNDVENGLSRSFNNNNNNNKDNGSKKKIVFNLSQSSIQRLSSSNVVNGNGNNGNNGCNGSSHDDDTRSVSSTQSMSQFKFGTPGINVLLCLVLVLGLATTAAFLAIGITGTQQSQTDEFHRIATDTITKVRDAFDDYVNAASMVHARCRHRNSFTRQDFKELYQYLVASGLDFKAVQFDPNITHEERPAAEEEARQYYAEHYPHVDYQGFKGFNTPTSGLVPRTNQSFYFPIHYMEPIAGNEAAIDLDYHSSESRMRAVYSLFDSEKPAMTDRLSLVTAGSQRSRCGDHDGPGYGVVLMHPGVKLVDDDPSDSDDIWPRDFSSVVLCIPALLTRATVSASHSTEVYIHDISDPTSDEPVFMGAALVDVSEDSSSSESKTITFPEDIALDDIHHVSSRKTHQENVKVANRVWTITVLDVRDDTGSDLIFVILGGTIIACASFLLAVWIYHNHSKTSSFNKERAKAEQEKAALILDNARQATKTERELNDFIAHEVRNPVAAAMAACNMMKIEINKESPFQDEETLDIGRGDLDIIDSSLRFVNDLLRNMLDMHRAASKQLQVNMSPVDLLRDILEPVGGMLYRRGSKIQMIVECPENFYVMADPLRLKQVVLNLGRNSSKFIDTGFIRLKAEEIDGSVKIYVDDSGSGIPIEKRQRLFAKFQESLDSLSQGTGVGLFLCKNLVELMGGEISLDDNYNSGIPGHPGTRFVIDLKSNPIQPYFDGIVPLGLEEDPEHPLNKSERCGEGTNGTSPTTLTGDEELGSLPADIPDTLSVLFVDDDAILRKLFSRSVKALAPGWDVREAANGETAIQLTEETKFDLIFVDMYMASVEKTLLGTETVSELRNNGVDCRICGLSANDKEEDFYEAGADAFMFKPFPCESDALRRALIRILYKDNVSGCGDAVDDF